MYDRELRQRCEKYNASSSLERFENIHIFFYFEKRSSQLQSTLALYVVVNSEVVGLAPEFTTTTPALYEVG
jgi:hypothetical protein